MATITCPGRVRPLYDWEIAEARTVFGDRLQYERVRVHECATWTDLIDRIGRRLKRLPPPGLDEHNSITLGNTCFFPVQRPEALTPPDDPFGMGWLIHELTHAWQFQQMGWFYLLRALTAQFRERDKAYDFGDAEGLRAARRDKWTLFDFNPEQQGDIAKTYYIRVRSGQDVSAWLPYIGDIQKPGREG